MWTESDPYSESSLQCLYKEKEIGHTYQKAEINQVFEPDDWLSCRDNINKVRVLKT